MNLREEAFKKAEEEMAKESPQLKSQIASLGGLGELVQDAWKKLYIPVEYPDELFQPFPRKKDFTSYINLLVQNQQLLLSLSSASQEAICYQVGFAQINLDGKLPQRVKNAAALMGIYQEDKALFQPPKEPFEGYQPSVINLMGKEFNNFGAADCGLMAAGVVKELRDSPVIQHIMLDLHEIVYITCWKYGKKDFRRNVKLYHSVAKAVHDSRYPDREKADFLGEKPLICRFLFKGPFEHEPTNYYGLRFEGMSDYIQILAEQISGAEHQTLTAARNVAEKMTAQGRYEREQAALQQKYNIPAQGK